MISRLGGSARIGGGNVSEGIDGSTSWGGRTRSRALGSIVDQMVCSAGNFLVLLAALHLLDLPGVAASTLAYTGVTYVLTIVRPLVVTPLVIRFTTASDAERARASGMAAGASLLIGLAVLNACAAASLLLPDAAAPIVLAAGLAVPAILVQDVWRYHCFASGRPWAATVNDGICLVAILVLLLAHLALGEASAASLIVVWGAGVGVGAVAGCLQLRLRPACTSGPRWIREQRDLGAPLAGAGLVMQSVGRISPVLIGAIVGMAALGRFSAAQSLMLPMNTVLTATAAFMLPESARRLQARGADHLFRLLTVVSLALGAAVAMFATVVFFLPDAIGRTYAGGSWDEAIGLLLPVAGWTVSLGLSYGSWIGLQTLGRSTDVLRVSVVLGTLQILGAAVGASTAGLSGGVWGITIGSLAATVLWVATFRRAARAHVPLPGPADAAVPGQRAAERAVHLT